VYFTPKNILLLAETHKNARNKVLRQKNEKENISATCILNGGSILEHSIRYRIISQKWRVQVDTKNLVNGIRQGQSVKIISVRSCRMEPNSSQFTKTEQNWIYYVAVNYPCSFIHKNEAPIPIVKHCLLQGRQ
jgi:hypothetical protein